MDIEAQQKVSPYLAPGERLIWAERPGQGLIFRSYDAFLIPFSLLWFSVTLFSMFNWLALPSGKRVEIPFIFLVLFAICAFQFILGRFLLDIWQRSRIYYGLSHERAIIVSGILFPSVRSFNLRATREIGFRPRFDGRGSITFGDTSLFGFGRSPNVPGLTFSVLPAFERIENAQDVYAMIQRAATEQKPL